MNNEQFDWPGYFQWLVQKVKGYEEDYADFLPVLLFLHKKEYTYTNRLDANRATDGKLLRNHYADEMGEFLEDEDLDVPPTVLEVLIGLAVHVESHITGIPGEDHPETWFWEWLENLGIDERCTGRGYDKRFLDQQIDAWLNGDITKRGEGSPFPLRHTAGDQRSKDMWMQCMAYVNEKMRYW